MYILTIAINDNWYPISLALTLAIFFTIAIGIDAHKPDSIPQSDPDH